MIFMVKKVSYPFTLLSVLSFYDWKFLDRTRVMYGLSCKDFFVFFDTLVAFLHETLKNTNITINLARYSAENGETERFEPKIHSAQMVGLSLDAQQERLASVGWDDTVAFSTGLFNQQTSKGILVMIL